MAILNKDLIKKNIFTLLHYSGLTDISFANLLNVSDKQIKRIRKGEAEFSIDDINKAFHFFNKSLITINSKETPLEFNYRDKLMEVHKGNTEYSTLLQKRPSITYAINFVLLNNNDFNNDKLTVKEISQIFRHKGWEFTSSYISLALKRNIDKIKVEQHPTKNRTFVYSKK